MLLIFLKNSRRHLFRAPIHAKIKNIYTKKIKLKLFEPSSAYKYEASHLPQKCAF